MKHSVMTWRKETRLSPVPPPDEGPEGRGGSAFDLWLRRGLHQLFDDVANEPVPEELLRLIEGDRELTRDEASPGQPDGAAPPDTSAAPDKAVDKRLGKVAGVHRTRGSGQ